MEGWKNFSGKYLTTIIKSVTLECNLILISRRKFDVLSQVLPQIIKCHGDLHLDCKFEVFNYSSKRNNLSISKVTIGCKLLGS